MEGSVIGNAAGFGPEDSGFESLPSSQHTWDRWQSGRLRCLGKAEVLRDSWVQIPPYPPQFIHEVQL